VVDWSWRELRETARAPLEHCGGGDMTTDISDGGPPAMEQPPPRGRRSGWTGGGVVSVVAGSLLGLIALGLIAAGVAGLVWNGTQRDDGYLTSSTVQFRSSGYAVSGDRVRVGGDADWGWQGSVLGKVRIRVTPADPARPIFVGIAATGDVFRYLSGVAWSRVQRIGESHVEYTDISGGAPSQPPSGMSIWLAKAQGTGTQAVTWRVHGGDWSVVAMNADGSRGVAFRANAGATVPWLLWVGVGALVLGVLLGAASVALIMVPVKRVGRELRERGPLDVPS
jgi:hypothetical protein